MLVFEVKHPDDKRAWDSRSLYYRRDAAEEALEESESLRSFGFVVEDVELEKIPQQWIALDGKDVGESFGRRTILRTVYNPEVIWEEGRDRPWRVRGEIQYRGRRIRVEQYLPSMIVGIGSWWRF